MVEVAATTRVYVDPANQRAARSWPLRGYPLDGPWKVSDSHSAAYGQFHTVVGNVASLTILRMCSVVLTNVGSPSQAMAMHQPCVL